MKKIFSFIPSSAFASWLVFASACFGASLTVEAKTPAPVISRTALSASSSPVLLASNANSRAVTSIGESEEVEDLSITPAPRSQILGLADLSAADLSAYINANAAVVYDMQTGETLFAKNADRVVPIASITKLMTAMVVLDAALDMDEMLTVTKDDYDWIRKTGSRLKFGWSLPRRTMLHLMVMSSENRAASALARTYPGGREAFFAKMNEKAQQLGMLNTRYYDSSGLHGGNRSTAGDLVQLINVAYSNYPLIRQYTTTVSATVSPEGSNQTLLYKNSNHLVKLPEWQVGLSKTGYIKEAGRCVAMQTTIQNHPVAMVLLGAAGLVSRERDAYQLRDWVGARYAGQANTGQLAVNRDPSDNGLPRVIQIEKSKEPANTDNTPNAAVDEQAAAVIENRSGL